MESPADRRDIDERGRDVATVLDGDIHHPIPYFPGIGEPDWTAVRSLADRADQYPNSALDSFASPPMRTGSDRVDNLIAGVAEIIADSNGREPLRW